MKKARKQGFTLVEILIVVVILGILAAIVIPQFTNASESAKASSLVAQLQTIRSQLELYQVQHNGDYPSLADLQADWGVFTSLTDVDGNIVDQAAADGTELGPYMQQPPVNPFEQSSTVEAAAADGVGWEYTEATAQVRAVMETTKAEEVQLDGATNDIALY